VLQSPSVEFTFMDILFPIFRWLNNPSIRDQMCFEPKERYDSNNQRIYSEFTDSDEAIQLYNCIFPDENGVKPLPVFVVLEIDDTPPTMTSTKS
jgi:hypothetical protein